jgi:urease accessory protein
MLRIETIPSLDPELLQGRQTDVLELEWFEATKRILRRKSRGGLDVAIQRMDSSPLLHNDVLWMDEQTVLLVSILPCEAIRVDCREIFQTACLCYDIGNRHAPIFWEENTLWLPFDEPMFRMLEANGYQPKKETKILQNMLRTNLPNHGHVSEEEGLFTRLMKKIQ